MRSAVEFGAQRVLTGSAIFPAQAQNVSNNIVPIRSGEHEIGHGLVRGLQRGGNCATGHAWRVGKRRKAWCVKMRGYPFAWPNRMALRAIGLHKSSAHPCIPGLLSLDAWRSEICDHGQYCCGTHYVCRAISPRSTERSSRGFRLLRHLFWMCDVDRMLCWHYPTPRS